VKYFIDEVLSFLLESAKFHLLTALWKDDLAQ
jgi:hypothetical protein